MLLKYQLALYQLSHQLLAAMLDVLLLTLSLTAMEVLMQVQHLVSIKQLRIFKFTVFQMVIQVYILLNYQHILQLMV